jgi:hypothetical protein
MRLWYAGEFLDQSDKKLARYDCTHRFFLHSRTIENMMSTFPILPESVESASLSPFLPCPLPQRQNGNLIQMRMALGAAKDTRLKTILGISPTKNLSVFKRPRTRLWKWTLDLMDQSQSTHRAAVWGKLSAIYSHLTIEELQILPKKHNVLPPLSGHFIGLGERSNGLETGNTTSDEILCFGLVRSFNWF